MTKEWTFSGLNRQNRKVLIAQCKHSAKGSHRPKEKDLTSLLSSTDWLASPQALEREGRPELVAAAKEYQDVVEQGFSTQLWFTYCGQRDENIDKRIRVYNANPENDQRNRAATHCHLGLLESLYKEARGQARRVDSAMVEVGAQALNVEGSFGKGLVVSVRASQLALLYEANGDQLFARNVRGGWVQGKDR